MKKIFILVVLLVPLYSFGVGFNEVPWVKYTKVDSIHYGYCRATGSASITLADSMANNFSLYAYAYANRPSSSAAYQTYSYSTASVTKTGFSVDPPFEFKVSGGGTMRGKQPYSDMYNYIKAYSISDILLYINSSWDTIWDESCWYYYVPWSPYSVNVCTTITSGSVSRVQIDCISSTSNNHPSNTYNCELEATNGFGISSISIEHIGIEENSNIKNPSTKLRASQNPFIQSTVISYQGAGKDKN